MNKTPVRSHRSRPRHWVYAIFGSAGVFFAVLFGGVAGAVLRSPADDDPIGMFAASATLISLLPAFGIVFYFARSTLRQHWVWLVASGLFLFTLALPAFIAASMLLA